MNKSLGFSDAFWATEFLSTAGFDALKKRVKDGRTTCKAFEDYLRLRAKGEEEYSKSIQKAIRALQDTPEAGTLRSALDTLRSETDKIATDHMDQSTHFNDSAARLSSFVERQKNERKPSEQAVEKSNQEKIKQYKKWQEAKRHFEGKSLEAEQADNVLRKAKQNENSLATKEWDKITKKQLQATAEANKARVNYRENVDKLDQVRIEWEKDMINYCETVQMLEEARIKMLQNEIWLKCNVLSTGCVEDDQHYENVRDILEKVDSAADIEQFILRASTGREKPVPIKFEEYESLTSSTTAMMSIGLPELTTTTTNSKFSLTALRSGSSLPNHSSSSVPVPQQSAVRTTAHNGSPIAQSPLYLHNRSYNVQ